MDPGSAMRPRLLALGLFFVLFVAVLAVLIPRSPIGAAETWRLFGETLARDLWTPLLWMTAAWGLGRVLTRLATPGARRRTLDALPLAVGISAMLVIDQFAGSVGALRGPIGAWALLVPGATAAVVTIAKVWSDAKRATAHEPTRASASHARGDDGAAARRGSGLGAVPWSLAPAFAVLLLAATSSPGHLWSTEFAGYDALSYHLALPRDWLELGRLAPVEWNAYSYIPSWIEGATLHLFALNGDPTLLGIRAQLLHAMIAVAATWCVAEAGMTIWRRARGTNEGSTEAATVALLAAALFIGTPWIVVTGSMAYNEMGASLACAALVLAWYADMTPGRRGVLLGALAAMALGSKLSAAVMVLPPVALLLLVARPETLRERGVPGALTMFIAAAVTAVAALSPWLVRNALATGNPFFPFAASIVGAGPWSAEQIEIWRAAHGSYGDLASRVANLWNQLFRFGFGENPSPEEPWRPFWGALPWIACAGALAMAARRGTRRYGIALAASLGAAALGWMLFTHMKSRFFIPSAPIAAIAGAVGVVIVLEATARRARGRTDHGARPSASARPGASGSCTAAAIVALVLSLQPAIAFWREGSQATLMIGAERAMTGDELAESIAAQPQSGLGVNAPRSLAFVINQEWAPLARRDGLRVLLIGGAATFRYRAPIRASTVWTRDPLVSRIMTEEDDETILRALRDERIGWVVIDPQMLFEVWQRSGWLDPAITPHAVDRATRSLEPLGRLPSGALLFRVPRAPDLASPPVLR